MSIFNFKNGNRRERRSVRKGKRPDAEYDPIDEGNPRANSFWSSAISISIGLFCLAVLWLAWELRGYGKSPDGVLLLPFFMGGLTFAAICFGAPIYWWWQRRRTQAVMEGRLEVEDEESTLDEDASTDFRGLFDRLFGGAIDLDDPSLDESAQPDDLPVRRGFWDVYKWQVGGASVAAFGALSSVPLILSASGDTAVVTPFMVPVALGFVATVVLVSLMLPIQWWRTHRQLNETVEQPREEDAESVPTAPESSDEEVAFEFDEEDVVEEKRAAEVKSTE